MVGRKKSGGQVMNTGYDIFGFEREPFPSDPGLKDILETEEIKGVCSRFDYAVGLGAIALLTGEIGSGKSTALRYAASRLHHFEYRTMSITAACGSILEMYRMLLGQMGVETSSSSRAFLLGRIRHQDMRPGVRKENENRAHSRYLTAVKADLKPALFPHNAEFFRVQLQATVFDGWMAHFVQWTGIPLAWAELCWQLVSLFLILWACDRIARTGVCGERGRNGRRWPWWPRC